MSQMSRKVIELGVMVLLSVLFLVNTTVAASSGGDTIVYDIVKQGVVADATFSMSIKKAAKGQTSIESVVESVVKGGGADDLPFVAERNGQKVVMLGSDFLLSELELYQVGKKQFSVGIVKADRGGSAVWEIGRQYPGKTAVKTTIAGESLPVSLESVLLSFVSGKPLLNKDLFWTEEKRGKRMIIRAAGKGSVTVEGIGRLVDSKKFMIYQDNAATGEEIPMFSLYTTDNDFPVYLETSSKSWGLAFRRSGFLKKESTDIISFLESLPLDVPGATLAQVTSGEDGRYSILFSVKETIPDNELADQAAKSIANMLLAEDSKDLAMKAQAGKIVQSFKKGDFGVVQSCQDVAKLAGIKTDKKCEKQATVLRVSLAEMSRVWQIPRGFQIMEKGTFSDSMAKKLEGDVEDFYIPVTGKKNNSLSDMAKYSFKTNDNVIVKDNDDLYFCRQAANRQQSGSIGYASPMSRGVSYPDVCYDLLTPVNNAQLQQAAATAIARQLIGSQSLQDAQVSGASALQRKDNTFLISIGRSRVVSDYCTRMNKKCDIENALSIEEGSKQMSESDIKAQVRRTKRLGNDDVQLSNGMILYSTFVDLLNADSVWR
jgi:hypothetical protein